MPLATEQNSRCFGNEFPKKCDQQIGNLSSKAQRSVYRLGLSYVCYVNMGMLTHQLQLYFLPLIQNGNKTYCLTVTVTVKWDGSHEPKHAMLLRANAEIDIYSFILNVSSSNLRFPPLVRKVHMWLCDTCHGSESLVSFKCWETSKINYICCNYSLSVSCQ